MKKHDGKKGSGVSKVSKALVKDYKAVNDNKITQRLFKLRTREEENNVKFQKLKGLLNQVQDESLSKVQNKAGN